MFRKIIWINLGVFVIIILLSYNLYRFWSRIRNELKTTSVKIDFSEGSKKFAKEEEIERIIDYKPSSRMSYSSIAEKDLFRPEREEWQPPPPPEEEEVETPKTTPYPQFPGQPQQPEMKNPTVHGIIIIGESKKYAIMQGWTREDVKERTRKIRLSDGQIREVPLPSIPGNIVQDATKAYRIGDSIAEAQIVDILPDKVVLEKEDGERYDIVLREKVKLDKWKPYGQDEQADQFPGQLPGDESQAQFPGIPPGQVQPYPIPPGVPVYPYIPPAYRQPVLPPGYIPPPGFIPGQGQIPPGQIPPNPRQFQPPPSAQNYPPQSMIPPGGRLPYTPPGQNFPGQIKR